MRFLWLGPMVLVMTGCTENAHRSPDLVQQVRQELTVEPPGSDAAVILAAAPTDAAAAPAERQPTLLKAAIEQTAKARRFKPHLEAPLPEGWPAPSLPGLVRLKTYPPMRAAWTEQGDGRNGRFMAYSSAEAEPPGNALGEPVAMAL